MHGTTKVAVAVATSVAVTPVLTAAAPGAADFHGLPFLEQAQYRDGSHSARREGLAVTPDLRAPRSLLRSYPYRQGPHYQPPSVVYEPPPVTYRPPRITDRTGCVPRTRAWYDRCAARYRSFDPSSGTYITYSGQERFCRCP